MEIDSFMIDIGSRFDLYIEDVRTKRATERNIEIIGEAMNRILKANHEIEISYSRNIVDARNRIIHGYDTVSDALIWSIVTRYLPVLKLDVEILVDEN
jgi:uncharacterized protein with HEPN domain